MMNWILPALLLLALLVLLLARAKRRKDAFPYQPVQALFTPAERSFLGVLDQAAGGHCRVFGKVRVADVATVKPTKDYRAWQRAFNRISAKHFDFVLCDPHDLSVLCAVELDDQSHRAEKRQERDAFIDTLCQTIGLPLIRIPARQAYSVGQIRQTLEDALGRPLGLSAKPHASPPPMETALSVKPERANPPSCPYCDSPMMKRTSRSGKNAGKSFWGCSQYPGCRGIVAMDAE